MQPADIVTRVTDLGPPGRDGVGFRDGGAGFPILAAIPAPSVIARRLAEAHNLTLIAWHGMTARCLSALPNAYTEALIRSERANP
jgi:hypothetical protein